MFGVDVGRTKGYREGRASVIVSTIGEPIDAIVARILSGDYVHEALHGNVRRRLGYLAPSMILPVGGDPE